MTQELEIQWDDEESMTEAEARAIVRNAACSRLAQVGAKAIQSLPAPQAHALACRTFRRAK